MVMMIAIIIKITIIIIINKLYKFLGYEQAKKIDVKRVMWRVNKEMNKRMEQWIVMSLYNENLIKATNRRVIPVLGHIMR